jgi:hypothetical protein
LISLSKKISEKPAESFPQIFSEEAELEGFYRFIRNPTVHWQNILEPHQEQTRIRGAQAETIIAIHDSSALQFNRKNKDSDLGIIGSNKRRDHYSREESSVEISKILTPLQISILVSVSRGKITEISTTKEFLYAVAKLGGHIRNNGAPGWIVLFRGFRELSTLERGASLAFPNKKDTINH